MNYVESIVYIQKCSVIGKEKKQQFLYVNQKKGAG